MLLLLLQLYPENQQSHLSEINQSCSVLALTETQVSHNLINLQCQFPLQLVDANAKITEDFFLDKVFMRV
jgi:hypothetical protein